MTNDMVRTCFVICPIGDDGTPIRQQADDLFDLVIEPALRGHHFHIVRADRIPRSTLITSDIVHLVQTAHLCIVDLTGSNPNVFYECGRRHETGKPFIQLLRKGETLPFDVAGIRTIQYDMTTPRSVHESSELVRKFVDELAASGFEKVPGESLSSIAEKLERIERRLTRGVPLTLSGPTGEAIRVPGRAISPAMAVRNPRQGFMQAIANGDLETAAFLLTRLEQILKDAGELAHAAAYLAGAGVEAGADMLVKLATTRQDELDTKDWKAITSSLNDFFSITDREAEGIERLLPIIDTALQKTTSDEDKAFFINQKAKLLYGAGRIGEATAAAIEAVRLAPQDVAYLYNLSICYDKAGEKQMAIATVDRYMQLDGENVDGDHLAHAVETYFENGLKDKAKAVLERLMEKDPQRANLLLFRNEDLKAI